jgi:hypothetical protein
VNSSRPDDADPTGGITVTRRANSAEHGPGIVEEFDAALVDLSATLSGQLVGPRSRGRGPHVGDCGSGSVLEEPYQLVVNGGV